MTPAEPLILNILLLVPLLVFFLTKNSKLDSMRGKFVILGLFGLAFAYVEGVLVVYLRGLRGILPFAQSLNFTLDPIDYLTPESLSKMAALMFYEKDWINMVEVTREAATIVMLLAVALLVAKDARTRLLAFLWAFSVWDFFYYISIFGLVRWPSSLLTYDVLFLIPFVWVSQVWFPLFISGATIGIISYFLFLNRESRN